MHAAFTARGVDRHYVRVMQVRRRLRFVLEALELLGVQRRGERQDFQRYRPAQGELESLIDHAHAPPADFAEDAKIAQRYVLAPAGNSLGSLSDGMLELGCGGADELQSLETLSERAGNLRVARQEVGAVGPRALFEGRQGFFQGPGHARVAGLGSA